MVDNINLESINERLGKLEKSNRMLRKTVIILTLVLIVAPIVGWQATTQFFKVIETEKLILRDSNGKERAVLLMDGDVVKFRLKNSKDSVMAMIGASENGGYINLNGEFKGYDESGNSNLVMTSSSCALNLNKERVCGWGLNDYGKPFLVIGKDEKRSTKIFQGQMF